MIEKEELLKSESDILWKELFLEGGSFGSEGWFLGLKHLGRKVFNVIFLKAIFKLKLLLYLKLVSISLNYLSSLKSSRLKQFIENDVGVEMGFKLLIKMTPIKEVNNLMILVGL